MYTLKFSHNFEKFLDCSQLRSKQNLSNLSTKYFYSKIQAYLDKTKNLRDLQTDYNSEQKNKLFERENWKKFKKKNTMFFKIPNWPTLKLHNFFVFDSKKNRWRFWSNQLFVFTRPNFGTSRPPHQTEISIVQTLLYFGTRWPAPPLFLSIMIAFKLFFVFYLRYRYVNVYYNRRIKLWCHSSWPQKIWKIDIFQIFWGHEELHHNFIRRL